MLTSEYARALDSKIDFAKRLAKQFDRTQYVCEIDDGGEFGERSIIVCDERYLDSDEYVAFDGRCINVVEPDGWVT